MPVRALKLDKEEYSKLNNLLEKAFKGAERDHRFLRLHKEKPISENYSRVYEYDPAVESGLDFTEKTFVAHCGIYPQLMNFGHATIINGGIRDVGSHPVTRGKGYGKKTMIDAKDFMFKELVDVSILFSGANGFYEKLGWRGGLTSPVNIIKTEGLEQLLKDSDAELSEFQTKDLEVRNIENKDCETVAELYNEARRGEFFAAFRTPDFWKKHFETQPHKIWEYVLVSINDNILACFNFELERKLDKEQSQIVLHIRESSLAPLISNPGSPAATIIFKAFLDFIHEEALDEEDKVNSIELHLSDNDALVKHLKSIEIPLENFRETKINEMILITNPYSLFMKIKPEIIARAVSGKLPTGKFGLKFDSMGNFPGGLKIENNFDAEKGNSEDVIIEIMNDDDKFETWMDSIEDRAVFESISYLSLFVGGIILPEELPDSPDDMDIDDEVFIEGNAKNWMNGVFSGISFDMYKLDHY